VNSAGVRLCAAITSEAIDGIEFVVKSE